MATRDQYKQYMLKEKYTKHTIDQYTGYYMNGFYNQAKLHVSSIMKPYKSIYDIEDIEILKSIYAQISTLVDYKEANEKYSGGINATYNLYVKFLESDTLSSSKHDLKEKGSLLMTGLGESTSVLTPTKKQIPFSIKEIVRYIKETGLLYTESLVKRFAFSLMSKRFLIGVRKCVGGEQGQADVCGERWCRLDEPRVAVGVPQCIAAREVREARERCVGFADRGESRGECRQAVLPDIGRDEHELCGALLCRLPVGNGEQGENQLVE